MIADTAQALKAAREALNDFGLLLLSDAALPSIVGLIVGEPLRTSWWGHPLGGTIYRVSTALDDDPEILSTKLVAGKVTFVHRRLWPAVLAVGSAREAWQLDGLSMAAEWLLARTEADGEVQTNDLPPAPNVTRKRLPQAARELERRLLIHATEIHTPTGAHAKVLETWPHWAASDGRLRPAQRALVALATLLIGTSCGLPLLLLLRTRTASRESSFVSMSN